MGVVDTFRHGGFTFQKFLAVPLRWLWWRRCKMIITLLSLDSLAAFCPTIFNRTPLERNLILRNRTRRGGALPKPLLTWWSYLLKNIGGAPEVVVVATM